ncbi:hypothetical protein GCM10012320_31020 [Sinomonas cellulolyticus]|uniref:DUF559 domain-containing protein n=1 Tax=Sinomonas cellulolyticus TaxID=2801916 RepID=A0ABS1JX82_9MICC|nr:MULTISPECIES: hypothetical protein [Sinomonas]MBL0703950.1 hypothetical protein [Sinomonas cellulolyticus]GHG57816.1 hypothetical protein GCM10012320_31020 [Sinomonas sp. KCTC 49339]
MTSRSQLPHGLSSRSFSIGEARMHGVSRGRLAASDLVAPTRGIRVPWGAQLSAADVVRPLLAIMPDSVASFITAAKIWGFPLPLEWERDPTIHVTRPLSTPGSVRPGVVCHRMGLAERDVVVVDGVPVTSRERTWLDLAGILPPEHVVAIGDYLVCAHPEDFPMPRTALVEIDALRGYLDAQRRVRGLPAARRAIGLVRVGADSVPETLLRLAEDEAGLPEPALNYVIRDPRGRAIAWPDQAFVELRFAIQYDGEHHRTAEQQASDNWRNRLVADVGWDQLIVSAADVRARGWDGVAAVVGGRLRRLEALRGGHGRREMLA